MIEMLPFEERGGNEAAKLTVQQEIGKAKDKELQLEVVAACLSVFTRLDSLL